LVEKVVLIGAPRDYDLAALDEREAFLAAELLHEPPARNAVGRLVRAGGVVNPRVEDAAVTAAGVCAGGRFLFDYRDAPVAAPSKLARGGEARYARADDEDFTPGFHEPLPIWPSVCRWTCRTRKASH